MTKCRNKVLDYKNEGYILNISEFIKEIIKIDIVL